jgi:hypothetical protein
MGLNRISGRFLVVFAAICTIGGFLAGSSRSQTERAEPPSEVGRFKFSRESVVGNRAANNYVIFDTKTGRAWEMDIRGDLEGEGLEWYAIPSPFDPSQKIVKTPAPKPDAKPESN